ncbi:hypothetical protein KCU62_g9918, partial [Aureobasidium sp. EXF-3399]
MKLLLLLTAAIYATHVSAFGDVGPYERAFFYYAYQADAAAAKDGIPTNISPGCGTWSKKGKGHICSFNEFNKYISDPDNEDLKSNWDVTKVDLPDPDTIARTMTDEIRGGALSSTYNCNNIWSDIGRNNVAQTFVKVGQFLSGKLDSLEEGPIKDFLKLNAYATITSVARIRKERMIQGMTEDLRP